MAGDSENWIGEDDDLEDYGLGGRMNALIHTVTGDYETGMDIFYSENVTQVEKILLTKPSVLKKQGLNSFEAEELSLYSAGHEGAHIRYTDLQKAKDAILYVCSNRVLNYDLFGNLIQIIEDARVDHMILLERPGFIDFKYNGSKGLIRCLLNRTDNKENAAIKSLTALMYGIDLRKYTKDSWNHVDWTKIEMVAKFIKENIQLATDSSEAVYLAYEAYCEMYGQPPSAGDYQSEDIIRGRPSDRVKNYRKQKEEIIERIVEKVNSEGLTELVDEKKVDEMKEDLKEYRKRKRSAKLDLGAVLAEEVLESINAFGEQIITAEEKRRLEKAYCVDIHARIPIHVCRGKISENLSQKRYQALQQNKKLNMQVEELSRRIKDAMYAANDKDAYTADHGVLIPNKVWKATKCNNTKIFNKVDETELGGFAVELILDASGSLSIRVDEMRKVAYVLTETIAGLGIPLRVEAFCNTTSHMVIQRYRDYEDDRHSNQRVTAYDALGDNRDSLAIRICGNELLKRSEQHKVMIVVSDGAPNNVVNSYFRPYGTITQLSYTSGQVNDPGVKYTAIQVRDLRRKGIALMGIYVGPPDERTLRAEKNIYGKDFSYVRHTDRIAQAVASYLEQQIKLAVNKI